LRSPSCRHLVRNFARGGGAIKAEVHSQTAKAKRFWRIRCEQMLESDELIEAKELEIASLRAQLASVRACGDAPQRAVTHIVTSTPKSQPWNDSCLFSQDNSLLLVSRKGKAPPVDIFSDQSDVLWEDWLPTFELRSCSLE